MNIHPSFFCDLQWPPTPHPLSDLKLSNREEWDKDEWRSYALILEHAGEHLLQEITDTQEKLRIAEEKLAGQKKPRTSPPEMPAGKTLLTSARLYAWEPLTPKPKVGRKQSKTRDELVNKAREKWLEMEESPSFKKATVTAALNEILKTNGMSVQEKRTILNDERLLKKNLKAYKEARKQGKSQVFFFLGKPYPLLP
jgi:hypothetical protein